MNYSIISAKTTVLGAMLLVAFSAVFVANAAVSGMTATINGGASATVAPGAALTIDVSANKGAVGGCDNNWNITRVTVEGQSPVEFVLGSVLSTDPSVHQVVLNAPATAGEYDVLVEIIGGGEVVNDNACSAPVWDTKTLDLSVVIAPSIQVLSIAPLTEERVVGDVTPLAYTAQVEVKGVPVSANLQCVIFDIFPLVDGWVTVDVSHNTPGVYNVVSPNFNVSGYAIGTYDVIAIASEETCANATDGDFDTVDFDTAGLFAKTTLTIEEAPVLCTDPAANNNGKEAPCTYDPVIPACIDRVNLLQNASFEDTVAEGDGSGAHGGGLYEVFDTIAVWTSNAGFEVWNNVFGGGTNGVQNLELAVSEATTISQLASTVIGNEYKLTYDFAARPDAGSLAENELDVLINDVVVDTISAQDTDGGNTTWGSYSYVFTATSNPTKVSFADAGTSNGVGSLLDNTVLCLTDDNAVVTYRIFGYVWNDANENGTETEGIPEEGEAPIVGRTVTINNGEEGENYKEYSTESDADGYYEFNVPAGTWTISDGETADTQQTFPINEGNVHVVTVPVIFTTNIFEEVFSFFIPTAHAQVPGFGPFNFGNVMVNNGGGNNGGGGNGDGQRTSLRDGGNDSSSDDEDDETPEGQVLGESTSVVPVGAPNTGAGGTAPLSLEIHTLVGILSMRKGVQATNGK